MAEVEGATLDVAPKGCEFAGGVVPKVLEGPVECMWGCSGRLGMMATGWDMPKSGEIIAEAATEFVVVGLTVGCCECN